MTGAAALRFTRGQARPQPILMDGMTPPPRDAFDWFDLERPTGAELAPLARHYGLHPLAVEDAINGRQLPKIERYETHLFVVARSAGLDGDRITHGEVAFFIGENFIISVRHEDDDLHEIFLGRLEALMGRTGFGPGAAFHTMIDALVDSYFPVLDSVEEDVLKVENLVLDGCLTREDTLRLFGIRHAAIRFQRQLVPMEEVMASLVHHDHPCIDRSLMPWLRDVLDHVRRAQARMSGLNDILSSVIETSNLVEQQRQGVITRQLAAWAAIIAVPTAIAGIYGMNFRFMPELAWRYGYPLSLGLMAVSCLILYVKFKRSGWL